MLIFHRWQVRFPPWWRPSDVSASSLQHKMIGNKTERLFPLKHQRPRCLTQCLQSNLKLISRFIPSGSMTNSTGVSPWVPQMYSRSTKSQSPSYQACSAWCGPLRFSKRRLSWQWDRLTIVYWICRTSLPTSWYCIDFRTRGPSSSKELRYCLEAENKLICR